MVRLLSVLVFGLFMEAVGVVLLSQGLKEQGELQKFAFDELLRFVQRALTNRHLLAGVALEAGFFGCLLYLMSHGDVGFVWPLTSLGFVLTTFAARFILHEPVSPLRWFGVFLIVLGAGTIIYTEKLREKEKTAVQAVTVPSRS